MAAYYTFEDLSGGGNSSQISESSNPYEAVITACQDDPSKIQQRYDTHRTARNAQQREKLLSSEFEGVVVDQILSKLENQADHPNYRDPRHCLVFWARPTQEVKGLIKQIQEKIREVVPNIWLMPQPNLHMTALEITHSLTSPEIETLSAQLLPRAGAITDFTMTHRARLVKPIVSFDAQALALSFLPAAGEPSPSGCQSANDDAYTYHHLRRDLFDLATEAGVTVASRYVIPSAHLTLARFIHTSDFEVDGKLARDRVNALVKRIDEINDWLKQDYWSNGTSGHNPTQWIIGTESGLDFRKGSLWYGGGETIRLGKGH